MGAIAVLGQAVFAGASGFGPFSWSAFGWTLGLELLGSEFGPTTQGPRLDNLEVGGSDYGRPIPHGYGTFSLAGNTIWAAPIKERAQKHGGVGQPKYTEYTYYGTFLQLFCAGPTSGKTMRLNRLWAVRGQDDEILLHEWNAVTANQTGYQIEYDPVTGVGTGTYGGDATAGEIIVLCGTDNQEPWSVIEEYEGVGSVPAYIKQGCVGLVNFPVGGFGNQIPTLRAEWVESSTTVEEICQSIAERVAVNLDLFDPATDCDFSALSSDALSSDGIAGFVCDSPAPATQYIDQLRTAYKFDCPDIDNTITAVKRGGSSILTLSEDDLGWHNYGDEMPPILDDKIAPESSIPRQIDLGFLDVDRDGKNSTQPALRQTVLSETKTQFSLGLYMKSSKARAIAEKNMAEAWVGRNSMTSATSHGYIWLAPSDPITVTRGSESIDVLLLDTHIRLWGPQDLNMVEYDRQIYTQSFEGEAAPLDPAKSLPHTPPIAGVFECNALVDAHTDTPCIYGYATRPYSEAWAPIRMMEYSAVSTLFSALSPNSFPSLSRATIGTVQSGSTPLGDWAGGSTDWDTVNSVTVDLDYGTLSSAAEDDVLAGANTAILGADGRWEVFRFTTATYVGTFSNKRRYTLSGKLWRGIRGTEFAIDTHADSDQFILINEAIEYVPIGASGIGVPKTWAFRDNLSIETKGDLATTTHTAAGTNMKPFSPAFLTATVDGSDIDIAWEERSRFEDVSLLTGVPPANAPYDLDIYKVEIYDGVTLVRTLTESLTNTSITYAAADIATDGFTTGETITISVSQKSSMIGWGYAATVDITAP